MYSPCTSFFIMARMGRLGSSGFGIVTVIHGFENILRKTDSTSATVCVMSTIMCTGYGSRLIHSRALLVAVMWSPETALNTGKGRNPNIAIDRGPHNHGGGDAGGAFTGGCWAPAGRAKPGGSE
jgi:hypothetical protein